MGEIAPVRSPGGEQASWRIVLTGIEAESESQLTFGTRPRQIVPAWLLSIVLHLVALIALAVLLRGPRTMGLAERDRPGGIVLAEVTDQQQVAYFDESGSESLQQSEAAKRAPLGESQALPDQQAMPVVADLSLPGAPAVVAPPDVQMTRPNLATGGKVRVLPDHGKAAILAEEAQRRANRRSPGPPGHVSLFGTADAVGRTFVFVIDRSKSMGSGGLNALRAATVEFQHALESLKPNHQFQILAYSHERVFFVGDKRFVPVTDANKQRVAAFMHGLAAFGGTDHEMALSSALYLKPDVIFFLTDGADPELTASQLAAIHKLAAGRTSIHCIQFGYGPGRDRINFMKRLAKQNGGSYRYINMSHWHHG